MERDTAIVKEVNAILKSPTFIRSKAMSGLLSFLLEFHLKQSRPPTQGNIAADYLGKDLSSFDAADSSVRVAMTRLRKALKDYYLINQPNAERCIYFSTGDYQLRFARLAKAYPDLEKFGNRHLTQKTNAKISRLEPGEYSLSNGQQTGVSQSGFNPIAIGDNKISTPNIGMDCPQSKGQIRPRFRKIPLVLLILFATIGTAILFGFRSTEPATARLAQPSAFDPPYVSAVVEVTEAGSPSESAQAIKRQTETEIESLLRKSMISRYSQPSDDFTDFKIFVAINLLPDQRLSSDLVIVDRKDRVLTEKTIRPVADYKEMHEAIQDEIIGIVSPAGHIARSIVDQIDRFPLNSFECFIVVEANRVSGKNSITQLDECIKRFPDSEFSAFLEVRRLFLHAQVEITQEGQFDHGGEVWTGLSQILEINPENPYANALAAKLLIASGQCAEAAAFATEAFSRGRTYPTLELSVIVDAFGCSDVSQYRPFWKERVRRIAAANSQPDPLLQSYLTLGLIISDQTEIMEGQKFYSLSRNVASPVMTLDEALLVYLKNPSDNEAMQKVSNSLPLLIFSDETRAELHQILKLS